MDTDTDTDRPAVRMHKRLLRAKMTCPPSRRRGRLSARWCSQERRKLDELILLIGSLRPEKARTGWASQGPRPASPGEASARYPSAAAVADSLPVRGAPEMPRKITAPAPCHLLAGPSRDERAKRFADDGMVAGASDEARHGQESGR